MTSAPRIAAARDQLAEVKQGDDVRAIREATVALDQATRHFAELMMEAAVASAIRGKTMDAAGEETGRRGDRAASHGAGGVQMRAELAELAVLAELVKGAKRSR